MRRTLKLLLLLGIGFMFAKDKDADGVLPGGSDNTKDPVTGEKKSDAERDEDMTYNGQNAGNDFKGVKDAAEKEAEDGRTEAQRQEDEMWAQHEDSSTTDSTTETDPSKTESNPDIDANYPMNAPHNISFSDLLHVCNGDPNKPDKPGGHLSGTGSPGKTEFPAGWDMEDVGPALQSVASNPNKAWMTDSGNYFAQGVYQGVTIISVVRPDGSIEAGWPVSGPGVTTNPG